MIARFGAFELNTIVNYLAVREGPKSTIGYIKGKNLQWWWNKDLIQHMYTNAGFFPPTEQSISQFCELMLNDAPLVDILGSWLPEEEWLQDKLTNASKFHLMHLEPFWAKVPWTSALEGRKVLVVHPFEDEIIEQYKKRKLLFSNKILPDFQLKTVKAIQTIAGSKSPFKDWFEALDFMKTEIDKIDYDICLIGAGAYGFPLAAHVKRNNKKAVHMGGALQLLFGIRGKRWEDPAYGVQKWGIPYGLYANLMNEHWIRPNAHNKPEKAENVEGSCYW